MKSRQKTSGSEKPKKPASPWKKFYQNLEVMQIQKYQTLLSDGDFNGIVSSLQLVPQEVAILAKLMGKAKTDEQKFIIKALFSASENGINIFHAVPALAQMLSIQDIRDDALSALGSAARKGADISASIPALAKILSGQDPIRLNVIGFIKLAAQKGVDITPALEALANGLSDSDATIKMESVKILRIAADKGTDISIAIPALAISLSDGNTIPWESIQALQNAAKNGINIGAAVPALARAISDPDEDFGKRALQVLGLATENGIDISEAFPALLQAISDIDEQVSSDAVEVLVKAIEKCDHKGRVAMSSALLQFINSQAFVSEADQNSVFYVEMVGVFQKLISKISDAEEKGRDKLNGLDEYYEEYCEEIDKARREEEYEDYH